MVGCRHPVILSAAKDLVWWQARFFADRPAYGACQNDKAFCFLVVTRR